MWKRTNHHVVMIPKGWIFPYMLKIEPMSSAVLPLFICVTWKAQIEQFLEWHRTLPTNQKPCKGDRSIVAKSRETERVNSK